MALRVHSIWAWFGFMLAGSLMTPAWAASEYGPVQPGQSVYAVAREYRPADSELSLQRWALAIFAANRDQFGPGMADLRAGSRLKIPSPTQAEQLWPLGEKLERGGDPRRLEQSIQVIMAPKEEALKPLIPRHMAPEAPRYGEDRALEYGPVEAGKGIYQIASEFRDRRDKFSLHQWAWAIFAANPQAFGDSVQSLKRGSVLLIPSRAQAEQLWMVGKQRELGVIDPNQATARAGEILGNDATSHLLSAAAAPAKQAPERDPAIPQDASAAATGIAKNGSVPNPIVPPNLWLGLTSAGAATAAANTASSSNADANSTPITEVPDRVKPRPLAAGADATLAAQTDRAPAGAFAKHPLFNRARASGGKGAAEELLRELDALEEEYAGDVDFDYLYGVLLLDNGRPQEALYALQRASQQRPKSLGMRMDLGRAYFEMGENESARRIFSDLAEKQPPARTAQVIQSYLRAIETRAARYERRNQGRLRLSAGHDSNANSATALDSFAGFQLDERSRSIESPYVALFGEAMHARPLTPRWSMAVGGSARSRYFTDADQLNTIQLGLNSNASYRQGNWTASAQLNGGHTRIDGQSNSHFVSLGGLWQFQYSPQNRAQLGLKAQMVRYADAIAVRDVDQLLASAGWWRRTNWLYGSELGISLIYGHDAAKQAASPYDRDLLGLGLSAVVQLRPGLQFNVGSNYLDAGYDGTFLGQTRDDQQIFSQAGLQLSSNRWRHWLAGITLTHVDNRSTVGLYDYDRIDVSLSLTRLFQ